MMAKSALQRLKELDNERQRIMEQATTEARRRVDEALDGLNALGKRFRLVEDNSGGRKGTRQVKDAPCKICGFRTVPPHDARRHRGQRTKKPFTNDELQSMGMRKT
jgi:hypothetical protein